MGLEASGKTVLMTVMAKKLSQTSNRGYFLDPIGLRTMKYIERNWAILQGNEWPASTPPGEMFKLKWNFHVQTGRSTCETASLQMIDFAGQDLRQLFTSEEYEGNFSNIPQHFRPLMEYLAHADILLVVLNIKDYCGETDTMRKIDNQAALKTALDHICENKAPRIAFVFTQMDQYEGYIQQYGGLENFCGRELSYLRNSYMNGVNACFSVSAVNQTETREMSDGSFQRVPVYGFKSKGLVELGDWLAKEVKEVNKNKAAEAERKRQEQIRRQQEQEQIRRQQEQEQIRRQQEQEKQRLEQQKQSLIDNFMSFLWIPCFLIGGFLICGLIDGLCALLGISYWPAMITSLIGTVIVMSIIAELTYEEN